MNKAPLDLLDALNLESLSTWFQPITNLRTGTVVGCEALVRGVNSDGTIVAPSHLFAAAAAADMSLALERAAREDSISSFAAARPADSLLLFLNFSAAVLDSEELMPGNIHKNCLDHGLDPRRVALEIVESGVRDLHALKRFAERNRAYGFLVTLDDFGTQHSNLERVALVRPDIIKIDQSIVRAAGEDMYKRSVMRSISYLARTVGSLCLAEGVESYDDIRIAAEEGADLIQGYHLAKPHPDLRQVVEAAQQTGSEAVSLLRSDLSAKVLSEKGRQRRIDERVAEYVTRLRSGTRETWDVDLRELVEAVPEAECAYIVGIDGIQLSSTILDQSLENEVEGELSEALRSRAHPLFRPAVPGDSHALKNYVYALLTLGHSRYVTDYYVSLAGGHLCRTLAVRVAGAKPSTSAGGEPASVGAPPDFILCVDLVEVPRS